jgi:hypothetical protein
MIDLNGAVAETIVINPPHFPLRRAASQTLCDSVGFKAVRFSAGTSGLPHYLACALAHRKAMDSITTWPSLILEDDLHLAADTALLPPLPENADLVYLSVTPFGCLPWTYENLALARHRAIQGLTLASIHNADWLKLHSMSGGQAILYVTEKGLDAWKQATFQARRFGGPFDVFTAYAMKDVNVYAPHRPIFCESGELQRDDLRQNEALLRRRLSFTRTPLQTFAAGDRTIVHFKRQKITVEAVEIKNHTLQWSVVEVEKADFA